MGIFDDGIKGCVEILKNKNPTNMGGGIILNRVVPFSSH